jgi:hypothetical protein
MLSYLKGKLTGFNCPQKGGGGGGGGGGTTTTTQELPPELRGLATAYSNKAMELSNTPYQAYGGQRNADMNGMQLSGMQTTIDRAMNGSATMNNAEANLNQMMSAGPNPYLDSMVNQAMGKVGGQVNSQFGGSNYGTTAHQQTLANSLGDTAAGMYGNAYASDQSNRLQAMQMAPTFGNAAYNDASQLMNVGQIYQDQAQKGLDVNYQNFQEQQNDPYKKLAAMSGVFGSNVGGSSTTTSDQKSSGGGK